MVREVFQASLVDKRRFLPFPNCFELFCFHVVVDCRGRVLLSQVATLVKHRARC
jgi:hypothetical protein